MKIPMSVGLVGCALFLSFQNARAADSKGWAGEYADKKFLSGSAVFQFTIEQSGSAVQVSFDAVKNDGQGCALEAQGVAKETSKGSLEFTFRDTSGNTGTGSVVRSADGLVVSLKATHVVQKACAVFFRDNIRVQRARK